VKLDWRNDGMKLKICWSYSVVTLAERNKMKPYILATSQAGDGGGLYLQL